MTEDIATRHPALNSRPGRKLDRYYRGTCDFTMADYDRLNEQGNIPDRILQLAYDFATGAIPRPDHGVNGHLNLDAAGEIASDGTTLPDSRESRPNTGRGAAMAVPAGEVDYLAMSVPQKFNIVMARDLSEDDDKKTWIIRDVWAAGEFSYIAAVPGAGKSVITGDAACHIAAGMDDWHGHDIDNPGFVLYFAAERARLVRRRIRAWLKYHGIDSDIPLMVVDAPISLTSETFEDADSIIAIVSQFEAKFGKTCRLVVIDTLSRVFGGGDQNTSKDMNKLVGSIDRIMSVIREAHLCVIHHTTWAGERAKGAIDLDGAVDASFLIDVIGDVKVLRNDGSNDGEEGDVVAYRLEGVELGIDDRGNPTKAPVVIKTQRPEAKNVPTANANFEKLRGRKDKASGDDSINKIDLRAGKATNRALARQTAHRVINELMATMAESQGLTVSEARGLSLSREAFNQQYASEAQFDDMPKDKRESAKSAMRRALADLHDDGKFVCTTEEIRYPAND